MTNTYERRIRKLEANHRPEGANLLVLGIPGWPEPSPEEISRATQVLRVRFISAKHGQQTEGASYAQH